MPNRERGVTVLPVDIPSIVKDLNEKSGQNLTIRSEEAVLTAADGTLYLVDREGVSAVLDAGGVGLMVFDNDDGGLLAGPVGVVTFTSDNVSEVLTGEEVDLADWVRSFGSRLEANFRSHHRLAAGATNV